MYSIILFIGFLLLTSSLDITEKITAITRQIMIYIPNMYFINFNVIIYIFHQGRNRQCARRKVLLTIKACNGVHILLQWHA